jgi:Pyruvate/2-oxoacid:ferredoxin oxidoreductase delta subunit
VIKLGPSEHYGIDYDFYKGCGIFATESRCGAIDMIPERI